MLTAGATLTPPIESSADANHAAGQQLECIKVSSTCQPYLRLTAASVSVRPPPYSNTGTRAGLLMLSVVADYVRLALRNQRTAVATHAYNFYEVMNPHNTFAEDAAQHVPISISLPEIFRDRCFPTLRS